MSNADPRGKFVWHELMTSDAGAATAFYTKVISWKSQPWEKDSSYSMWVAKNGPVGGVASLSDSGSPRWIAYVGVSDVAATVESAKGLGARVIKDATEIPNGGVYALLADPQGAEFGIYASAQHSSDDMPEEGAGDFTWHELATTDAQAAIKFYSKLFGWEVGDVHDMGPSLGNYHLIRRGGKDYAGVFVSKDSGPPSWLCYVGVEDAGKAVNAAKAAGGRIVNGPMEVPGGSWVAQVLDGEGVAFAVHEPAKASAAKAANASASAPAAKPKAPKPPKAKSAGGAASSITKPPEPDAGGAASSITKPPKVAASGGGAASSITKPPEQPPAEGGGGASVGSKPAAKPKSSVTKPPKSAKKPAAKSSVTKPPKAAAKKGKKAAAKKAPAKAAAKKTAAKKGPAKKKKSSPKPKSSITKPPKGKKKAPAKKKKAAKKK